MCEGMEGEGKRNSFSSALVRLLSLNFDTFAMVDIDIVWIVTAADKGQHFVCFGLKILFC